LGDLDPAFFCRRHLNLAPRLHRRQRGATRSR
jgi:hypothetical protein